jgi:hypothetical protein
VLLEQRSIPFTTEHIVGASTVIYLHFAQVIPCGNSFVSYSCTDECTLIKTSLGYPFNGTSHIKRNNKTYHTPTVVTLEFVTKPGYICVLFVGCSNL